MSSEHPDFPQVSALQVAAQSIHPLADETDRNFVIRHLPEQTDVSTAGLETLQKQLDDRESPALVHELHDVYIQSTHWMVCVGGELVADTLYLIHDEHVARNLAMINLDESVDLDPLRLWVLGANYAPGNYWHWHAQSLPAILHALETIPARDFHRISILTGPLTNWQRDGLAALGLGPDQVEEMPRGKTVRLERFLYSDLLSSRQVFGLNSARRRTAEVLRRAARSSTLPPAEKTGCRLYISRGDTTRRPLVNEDHLSTELESLGFAPITNTKRSLLEQVRMYEAADIVVAPHGAGSTNMFFMQPDSSFVEFQQASHVNAGPLSLGKTSGLTPYAEVFNDDGLGQATEGWTVDVQRAISLVRIAVDNQGSRSRRRY
jgi:capsular polysaccharide biosynthesis protein